MSCWGCFSAMTYFCGSDECDWVYTHGLNPSNPRFDENKKDKPSWLPDDWDCEKAFPGTEFI